MAISEAASVFANSNLGKRIEGRASDFGKAELRKLSRYAGKSVRKNLSDRLAAAANAKGIPGFGSTAAKHRTKMAFTQLDKTVQEGEKVHKNVKSVVKPGPVIKVKSWENWFYPDYHIRGVESHAKVVYPMVTTFSTVAATENTFSNDVKSIQWTTARQAFACFSLFPIFNKTSLDGTNVNSNYGIEGSLSLQTLINKGQDLIAQDTSQNLIQTINNPLGAYIQYPILANQHDTSTEANSNGITLNSQYMTQLKDYAFAYHGGSQKYHIMNTYDYEVDIIINEYTPRRMLRACDDPVHCMMQDIQIDSGDRNQQSTWRNTQPPLDDDVIYNTAGDFDFGPKTHMKTLHTNWNVGKPLKVKLAPGEHMHYTVVFPSFVARDWSDFFEREAVASTFDYNKLTTAEHIPNDSTKWYANATPKYTQFDFCPMFSKFVTMRIRSEKLHNSPTVIEPTGTANMKIPTPLTQVYPGFGQVAINVDRVKHHCRHLPSKTRPNIIRYNKLTYDGTNGETAVDSAQVFVNTETNKHQNATVGTVDA